MLALLLAIALFTLSQMSDSFFTKANLLNQGRLMAEVGLVAMPMTLHDHHRRDRSVGRLGRLACARSCSGVPVAEPRAAAASWRHRCSIACGRRGCRGCSMGWFITRVGVPPLIMTLATLALFRGLAEGHEPGRARCAAIRSGSTGSARARS
jgi:rhamnose transport system permease protein